VEDRWPMRDPSVFVERPELGPSFHPGEDYEGEFIGRALEAFGSTRSIFWGIGADQLFIANDHQALNSLLHAPELSLKARILQARRQFGTKRLIRHLLASSRVAGPLRSLRDNIIASNQLDALVWRVPAFWVIGRSDESRIMMSIDAPYSDNSFLSRWSWELVVRGLRLKSYRWSATNHLPYLRADFVNAVLTLSPLLLRDGRLRKGLLRCMARSRLPDSIRLRPKGGVFSKVVESGLGGREYAHLEQLFSRDSALADLRIIEPRAFLNILASYRSFCWSHQSRRESAGEMIMWRTIAAELWCRRMS
jgi:hypothetical protein